MNPSISLRQQWKEMIGRSWSPVQWFDDGDPPQSEDAYGEQIMWVYRMFHGKWSVGFFAPDKSWYEESTHSTAESAALRVHWLNGGKQREPLKEQLIERPREV